MSLPVQLIWIPGMAADERLFAPLEMPAEKQTFVRWSYKPGVRTLAGYAERLADELTFDPSLPSVYIGSSMGGMLAVELNAIRPASDLILLSAPAARSEFPSLMKSLGKVGAANWFSPKGLMRVKRLSDTFMGFKNLEDRQWFYENLETYGPDFLHFAVQAILKWERTERPGQYLQVVGAQDQLFRHPKMQRPIVIPGSGHFLTKEQPEALNLVLKDRLEKLCSLEMLHQN